MDLKLRAEMLGRTEEEIRMEMASALGRIGRRFQDLILRLKQPEVSQDRRAYVETLQEARLYYWYLIVQREALGLRDHSPVLQEYAVPDDVLGRK